MIINTTVKSGSNVSTLGGTTTAVLPSGAGGGPSASLRMTLSLSLGAVQLGIPVLFASNFILYAAHVRGREIQLYGNVHARVHVHVKV